MTCGAARSLFSRALDGRLAAGDREALASHLSGCAACRAERRRWESLSRALRAGGPSAVPTALAERAWRAAIAAPPAPADALVPWFVSAARSLAVAGAVAAAVAWLLAAAVAPPADVVPDPAELAFQLWTAEVGGDAR